jgi:hypothetical protein
MPRPRPPILLGLALGSAIGAATGVLILRHSSPAPAPIINHPSSIINNWSWRDPAPPPRLTDTSRADAALAAWLALRASDGGPADFATRAASLRALLLRLPPASFPRLLDRVSAAKDLPEAETLRNIAFRAWIELDPAAAARWAATHPELRDLLGVALDAWSAIDPRAAATWTCLLPDEKQATGLAYYILPALAEIDASAAIALATSRGESFRQTLLPGVLAVLAQHDPAATMRTHGPAVWNGGKGFFQLQKALGAWADRDPAAVIAWVLAQPAPDYDPTGQLSYIAVQPANRAAFAQAILDAPGLTRRQEALGGLLANWAGHDPASALAWLTQIPDSDLRAALIERALSNNFDGDLPDWQLPLALALPESENRRYRLAAILEKWTRNAPTDALRWLEAHAQDADVAAAIPSAQAAILGVIARDDPTSAIAEWQKLPEGETKARGAAALVAEWGQSDPGAALQWQSAHVWPFRTDQPWREMIFQWARQDAGAALRWAESLDGKTRRQALASLTTDGAGDSTPPAAAAELYSGIRDPALREETLANHVREWLTKDPAAAKAWLENHDALTPAQAASLLAAPAP